MASPGGDDGVSGAVGSTFPAADIDRELHPGHNKHVEVDPISSEVAASVEAKEKAKRKAVEKERKKEAKKKDSMQSLKKAFIVSSVIAAVAAAAFAIVKTLREKN